MCPFSQYLLLNDDCLRGVGSLAHQIRDKKDEQAGQRESVCRVRRGEQASREIRQEVLLRVPTRGLLPVRTGSVLLRIDVQHLQHFPDVLALDLRYVGSWRPGSG